MCNQTDVYPLKESNSDKNPFRQFSLWYNEAVQKCREQADAMVLATTDEEGKPSARVVLMKTFSEEGFIFYTNSLSRKGMQISFNPNVALLFYWPLLARQVRIEGQAGMISGKESDEYFISRPRGSRISALISPQSEVIPGREYLEKRYKATEAGFKGRKISRPEFWNGYLVIPECFEFWQGRENRLHDRLIYTYDDINTEWVIKRLAP